MVVTALVVWSCLVQRTHVRTIAWLGATAAVTCLAQAPTMYAWLTLPAHAGVPRCPGGSLSAFRSAPGCICCGKSSGRRD